VTGVQKCALPICEFKQVIEDRWPERKVIAWRTQQPFLDRVPPGIAAATKTGKLTVQAGAVVRRITTNPATGLATGAIYIGRKTKREHRVYSDAVIIAGSPVETVRLLLNSGSRRHPDGLGNSTGLLGRYFMDQTIAVGFFDSPRHAGQWETDHAQDADPFYGNPGGFLIPRYVNLGAKTEPFLRGFAFQGLGGRVPVPPGAPGVFGYGAFGEMLSRFDNKITLSGIKDRWGMPIPRIDLSMGANDRLVLRQSMVAMREMAQEFGVRTNFIGSAAGLESMKIWPDFNPLQRAIFRQGIKLSITLGAAIHECGGARMGTDPSLSVTNAMGQLWDAPNVLVADAATFVSAATVGPALTVMALGMRAGAHVADGLRGGGLIASAS
jgi:choline dehydrogenase-like flavoprotein